ncbi:MAG: exodeoxyribonuclease VII large subunit, partial [Alistipes sp.]
AAAEESIVAALCSIADRQGEFDAVVIIRGGGSTSDLNCFNGYRICSYIAQFPLPVITGIGHDKDTSVADLVAHTALKTPTAVAGWLIERLSQSDAWLDAAAQQLHDAAIGVMRSCELTLTRQQGELVRLSSALTARQSLGLENMMGQLPIAVGDFITRQRRRLEGAEELVLSRSPQRILQLGFAVVRGNGLAVTSVRAVHVGEQLAIEVSDGTFTTEVK